MSCDPPPLQIPNDEMYWVVTTIVSETRADSRAKFIKHFVKIASKCVVCLPRVK